MTEDEAKTKACCNGALRPAQNGPCIASACMAWRREVTGRDYTETLAERPAGDSWEAQPDNVGGIEWSRYGGGYCGLAGRWE